MAVEAAEYRMMRGAPRQDALGLAHDGFHHRPGAAAELKRIAAHEAARRIGLVKLLAPQTNRRRAVAVGRGFRALRAGRRAVAEIDAARPALVVCGCDRGIRWPPVPAELVHGFAERRAGAAKRQWRHWRFGRRKSGIAG